MKRDLLIGSSFILAASQAVGVIVLIYVMQTDDNAPKTIKPKSEPIAQLQAKEIKPEVKTVAEVVKKIPLKEARLIHKEASPTPPDLVKRKDDKPKAEPVPIKTEPKADVRKALPAVKVPAAKEIVLGNIIRIKNPDGEYTVEPMMQHEHDSSW